MQKNTMQNNAPQRASAPRRPVQQPGGTQRPPMQRQRPAQPQRPLQQRSAQAQSQRPMQRSAAPKKAFRLSIRKILMLALIIIFIFSTTMFVLQLIDDKRSEDIYNDALNIALGNAEAEEIIPEAPETVWIPEPIEDDRYAKKMEKINLDALREHNEEVIGWIRIPGTKMDYPIMQTDNNEYYLSHAWNNVNSSTGAIFMECRSNPDFKDYNTIVYGHNMRSGAMFAVLRLYTTERNLKKWPNIYIRTDEGVFRYEIFSSFYAPLDSPVYGLSFNQTETKENLLKYSKENSEIESEIEPALTDRILTLSTCTNTDDNLRWIVQARLKMIEVPADQVS